MVAVKEEVVATPEAAEVVAPGAEPEVLKKGKKDEDAAAGDAAPAAKTPAAKAPAAKKK